MVNKTRRTEIQIETRELTIIRVRGRQFSAYCGRCQKTVAAFTFEQVRSFFPVADIRRSIETKEIHLVEAENGSLVCGNSLVNKQL